MIEKGCCKMLLTVNKKYPPEVGGIEFVAKELAEIGFELYGSSEVITFNCEFKNIEEKTHEVKVYRLKAFSLNRSVRVPFGYIKILKNKALRASNIIYHFPSFIPELLLLKNNTQKICLYQADIVGKGIIGEFYNRLVVKRFLDSMDKIVVTSPNMKNTSELLEGRKNIFVIPLGIDVNHFKPEGDLVKEKILNDFNSKDREQDKILLFVGRIARYKGLDILLKSLAKLPTNYKLVIVTNGYSSKINRLIRKLEIKSRVRIYNGISYNELPEYYRSGDVLCMPSTDRGEAFGLVAVESMACGTPVVTTELGTGTSYHNIDGKTGRIIKPNDIEQLKDAIINICSNEDYDKKTIRDRSLKFSLENFRTNWINMLKNEDI